MANRKVRALPHGISIVKPTTKPPDHSTSSATTPLRQSHLEDLPNVTMVRRRTYPFARNCHVCGIHFMARRSDAFYCGPRCRKIISRFHARETNIGALTLFCELYPFSKIAEQQRKAVGNA